MAQIYECLALRNAASVETPYDKLSDALAARGMSDALERLERWAMRSLRWCWPERVNDFETVGF